MSRQRSLGRRIGERLRDLGLGLEGERCQGEAIAQRGLVSQNEGSERARSRVGEVA